MDIKALNSLGFNTDKALDLLGGAENVYQKIVNTYYQTAETKISDILKAKESGDIKIYTVLVHALKSSSRQIGADELGEMAYHLELSGKAGDIEEINKETDSLIAKYRYVAGQLESFVTEKEALKAESAPKKGVSKALLKAKLLKLKQSAKKFDIDSINKTFSELSEYGFEEEQNNVFCKIGDAVKAYKYDIIASEAENLISML